MGDPFDVVSACAELTPTSSRSRNLDPGRRQGTDRRPGGVARLRGTRGGALAASCSRRRSHPASVGGPQRRSPSRRRLWVGDSEDVARMRRGRWGSRAESGSWGIAVLSRLPVRRVEVVELGRLRRDREHAAGASWSWPTPAAPRSRSWDPSRPLHPWSAVHFQRLRRRLPPPDQPGVLAGDMNFWGPPTSLALPGWRRAVRARTYPSWRAHSQIDHILVNRAVEILSGDAVAVGNSDHWPVRRASPCPEEGCNRSEAVRSDLWRGGQARCLTRTSEGAKIAGIHVSRRRAATTRHGGGLG